MQNFRLVVLVLIQASLVAHATAAESAWTVHSQDQWKAQTAKAEGFEIKNGMVSPSGKIAMFQSKIQKFSKKRSAVSIVFDQSPVWQNWNGIENVGPSNLQDAPVMLSLGPDNYWLFGRYGGARKKKGKGKAKPAAKFEAKPAKLEGFDVPLLTTPYSKQFNAPGGLNKSKGGYHAWQSRDMISWVHHGPVTEGFSRWVTSAESVDGKTYIYYDYPNDQDPHLYIDEDLFDGVPGKNMGKAFDDPSHGSDAGFIRDLQGRMHVIYEDWSPINASKRSWDSPLAGHAVSKDGINDFKIVAPAIDNRTKKTGEIKEYKHPHWLQHKDFKSNIAKYNVHEPEQEAYGDWAAISIGGQYYLFGDFDPVGGHQMAVGWFTSSSIDKPFTWCDKIGTGHPDPDIGFAEGQFYLVTQQKKDWVSPGPWVEKVEARVGVDTNNDGAINQWTDWAAVKESYDYTKGFSKQITKTSAKLDLSKLPAGFGFQFEFKVTDMTENKSKPIMDKVTIQFAK
jgi:hypothetical protein